MAAGNVAISAVIGGVIGASFGKALHDSSAKVKAFQQQAERVRGFRGLIGDTVRLREEMAKAADKGSDAFGKMTRSHDANVAKLRAHGIAVDRLDHRSNTYGPGTSCKQNVK